MFAVGAHPRPLRPALKVDVGPLLLRISSARQNHVSPQRTAIAVVTLQKVPYRKGWRMRKEQLQSSFNLYSRITVGSQD